MSKILIIEDDPTTMVLIRHCLQPHGHRLLDASDGTEGLRVALSQHPELVVLDVNLPNLTGFEVCEALRRADYGGAILMLTARHSIDDKVAGLKRGADDYMGKPFDLREFVARIDALLRRRERQQVEHAKLAIGDIEIDLQNKVASRAGKPLVLTKTEWSILALLAKNQGKAVSRDKMLDAVWGYDRFPSPRTVDTHVWRLRRKLSDTDETKPIIRNVHGEGYKLGSPSVAASD